jgi:recombination protein U
MNRRIQGREARKAGGNFETYLDDLFTLYSKYDVMHIEKTPEPMRVIRPAGPGQFIACFQKSAQPDYKGTMKGGRCIVLEAKHTDSDRILQSALTENERDELEKYYRMGAIAGVVVSFGMRRICYIPYIAWKHMDLFAGHKHIKAAEAEPWEAPCFSKLTHNIKEYLQSIDKKYQTGYISRTTAGDSPLFTEAVR